MPNISNFNPLYSCISQTAVLVPIIVVIIIIIIFGSDDDTAISERDQVLSSSSTFAFPEDPKSK